jgi:Rad3-related DNA helicase
MNILDFFPYSSFRKNQRETIEKIQAAFDSDKKYVLLESPTGSGKSAIAITLSLYNSPAYILTSQKVLQDQYTNDYESTDVRILKGKSNYECKYFGDIDCKEGCNKIDKCPMKGECEYEVAKRQAQAAKVALMNYSYFFHVMEFTDSFQPRKLIICDECHRGDAELMKFVEFSFSSFWLSKLGITSQIPEYETTNEYVNWLNEIKIKIKTRLLSVKHDLDELKKQTIKDLNLIKDFEEELESLVTLDSKIIRFLISCSETEWIFEIIEAEKTKTKSIFFKPLMVSHFTETYLFSKAQKVFLMSATVLSKKNMCNNFGIKEEDCVFIKVPSNFPNENRPMYLTRTGSMSMGAIDKTLPKIVSDLEKVLKHHPDVKGIVHTHTYKITQYIMNNISNEFRNRIMTHTAEERESKLQEYMLSSEPKVLLAPSMTDGVDLKDDLARFVVIVKIPYLYLGDKQVKRRMEIDGDWYRWKAALTLVQAAGRAMRHEEDYCTIYIMDSAIGFFLRQNNEYFPEYFIDSIQN